MITDDDALNAAIRIGEQHFDAKIKLLSLIELALAKLKRNDVVKARMYLQRAIDEVE